MMVLAAICSVLKSNIRASFPGCAESPSEFALIRIHFADKNRLGIPPFRPFFKISNLQFEIALRSSHPSIKPSVLRRAFDGGGFTLNNQPLGFRPEDPAYRARGDAGSGRQLESRSAVLDRAGRVSES
jgi:hypothetical protein